MAAPEVTRDGDVWLLTWQEHGIGMAFDHLRESSDGLHAEVLIESTVPAASGHMHGPARLNLLSTESQTRLANALTKKDGAVPWLALVTAACARVTKDFRAPTPTLDLSTVDTTGGVPFLIPGFLPENETTILYGDGASGKSLLALYVTLCCRLGLALPWGPRPTRQCNVLYLDWETNPRTVASRLKRLAWGLRVQTPQVQYRQMFRSLDDEVAGLRFDISRNAIDLIVVDSIGFAVSGPLVEDQTGRAAINALRSLPCTRLVVGHIRGEDARTPTGKSRPFGSVYFWNGMRAGWEVRRAEETSEDGEIDMGLFNGKANDPDDDAPRQIGLQVAFDGRDGPICYMRADLAKVPELAERMSLSARLRNLLRSGAKDTKALASAVNANEEVVYSTLRKMPSVQQLNQGVRGRGAVALWGLTNPGEEDECA